MGDIADNLNYDYNYNMFLAKVMLPNLARVEDRQKVVRWINKLSSCNRSVAEMKLRNDFMYFLVLNVQNGELQAPFNDKPPASALPDIANLLPGGVAAGLVDEDLLDATASTSPPRPMLYQNSPDGGAFLAAQPVPRCGAFCYLAVVARAPNQENNP